MILIILLTSSFKMNKVNPFPPLTSRSSLILHLNLFIAFKAKLPTNPGKLSLVKGITRSVITFLPKLPNREPKDPPG